MIIWPEYISLKNWAANLVYDYPAEYLPQLEDEKKWEEWGSAVVATGVFARNSIPAPFSIAQGAKRQDFKNWQEWAKVFYNLMTSSEDNNV